MSGFNPEYYLTRLTACCIASENWSDHKNQTAISLEEDKELGRLALSGSGSGRLPVVSPNARMNGVTRFFECATANTPCQSSTIKFCDSMEKNYMFAQNHSRKASLPKKMVPNNSQMNWPTNSTA